MPLLEALSVIKACKKNLKMELPKIFEDIANSKIPNILGSRFSTANRMVKALTEHPEGFCKSSQLLALWESNGHTLVGYLSKDKQFIEWSYEDGPNNYDVISSSYNGLLGYIFRPFLYSKSDQELVELAKIFELKNLENLLRFKTDNVNWEDEIIQYLESTA